MWPRPEGYLELVPGRRPVCTDAFDDPGLPGEMKVTVELKAVSVGTAVDIEQQGVPDVISPEAFYPGWQDSLRKLARLVEPETAEQAGPLPVNAPRSSAPARGGRVHISLTISV